MKKELNIRESINEDKAKLASYVGYVNQILTQDLNQAGYSIDYYEDVLPEAIKILTESLKIAQGLIEEKGNSVSNNNVKVKTRTRK